MHLVDLLHNGWVNFLKIVDDWVVTLAYLEVIT